MRNFIILTIILIFSIAFFNTCSIEDSTMYYREPTLITVNNSDPSNVEVTFYGYNKETDNSNFVFVGYDIWYYFDSPSNAKKAAVRNPKQYDLTHKTPLLDVSADAYTDPVEDRFPGLSFPYDYMNDLYQYVTIPVSLDMIEDILFKGNNDNVVFYFHDDIKNDASGDLNPKVNLSEKYIMIDQIYPNYNDYSSGKLYEDATLHTFDGFYDYDYYIIKGISKYEDSIYQEDNPSGFIYYRMYFWIVAKGFNSFYERNSNYMESVKSEVMSVVFRVQKTQEVWP